MSAERKGETEQIIAAVGLALQEYQSKHGLDVVGVFVYGSFAKETYTDRSDIDVALLTNGCLASFGTVESKFSEILRQRGISRETHIFPLLDINDQELIETVKKDLFANQFIEIN